MRTVIKLLLLVSIIYSGYQLWGKDFIEKVKSKTIEITKPSAKRAELLDKISQNLNEIGSNLVSLDSPDPKQRKETIGRIGSTVKDSKNIVDNINELNEKNDGVVTELVSNISKKILGQTPTPTICPIPSK